MAKHKPPEVTDTVIHVFDFVTVYQEFSDTPQGFAHRLRLGARPGPWMMYTGIAKRDAFRGTTDYYKGTLPACFKVVEPKTGREK